MTWTFESVSYLFDIHDIADLAHLVEQPPCKRQAVCSSQTVGTNFPRTFDREAEGGGL